MHTIHHRRHYHQCGWQLAALSRALTHFVFLYYSEICSPKQIPNPHPSYPQRPQYPALLSFFCAYATRKLDETSQLLVKKNRKSIGATTGTAKVGNVHATNAT
jgi:hypothetical protein